MQRTGIVALLLAAMATLAPMVRAQDPTVVETAATVLAPIVRGQDYSPPEPVYPIPLGHARMDDGGLYCALEFLYMKQTNPLKDQIIANRGIIDMDGSISQDLGLPPIPGTFIGTGTPALIATDVGPATFVPGYNFALGWRFRTGLAVEFSWWHLEEAKYTAGASIEQFGFFGGPSMADTFISSPVFNFPIEFAGPDRKVALGNAGATFGIWDAASSMQIQLTQRFDQWEFTGRIPVYDNDDIRLYGLVGPRIASIWERFKWRTVSIPFDPNEPTLPDDVAIYSNTISNRLYGFHVGCGSECRLSDTAMGTFACSIDLQGAMFVNLCKTRAKYEREDRGISAHRSRRFATLVPELQGQVNLWWYPIEAIQLRVGYNAMGFFNTIASQQPVSFNFGGLDPQYDHVTRFFHGLNAGIAFIF